MTRVEKKYARTDLAAECSGKEAGKTAGTAQSVRSVGGFRIERLIIRSREAAKTLGKPCGTYVTVECGRVTRLGADASERLARILAGEIRGMAEKLTGKVPDPDFGVFIAGLGNAELTADALGPGTVGKLTVTRHLREYETGIYRTFGCCALSAVAPGVLGQTGIETLEILRGTVKTVAPDLVIVIDALAARSCTRLASTVQLSDTGIEPGSGVGNHRSAINQKTLGVPVIVLGLPTVVDSSSLVYDALEEAGITEIGDSLRKVLKNGRSFFVSPKDSDLVTERASALFARALELAFGGKLSADIS